MYSKNHLILLTARSLQSQLRWWQKNLNYIPKYLQVHVKSDFEQQTAKIHNLSFSFAGRVKTPNKSTLTGACADDDPEIYDLPDRFT